MMLCGGRKNEMNRGYVFALEALLGLLVFAALFAAMRGMEKNSENGAFARIAQYQALEDLLEVGVRNYGGEFGEFAGGDGPAKEFLQEKYSKLAPALGNFCFTVRAEGGEISVNCAGQKNRTVLRASRLLFNGTSFFEVSATLSD